MTTTFGSLYPRIYDFDNLMEAYKLASRGKRYREEALRYRYKLEENLINLQNHLIWHSWTPEPFRYFTVHEPKKREIAAPAFPDRVLHHAFVRVIEPLFERRFLPCSFACRKGKGTHAAVDLAERYIRSACKQYERPYIFKGDIKSYFASIPHEYVKAQYRRTIRCADTLWLMDKLIDTGAPNGVGLPIGALTSQILANVVLDPMDHYAKERLKVKRYLRYMDDFIAVCPSKVEAKHIFWELRFYAEYQIGLELNPKSRIQPISKGLNFCGYRIWPGLRLPRKGNVGRMRKRIRRMCKLYLSCNVEFKAILQVWASFMGYMSHCNSRLSSRAVAMDLLHSLRGAGGNVRN